MKKTLCLLGAWAFFCLVATAQVLTWKKTTDPNELNRTIPLLAKEIIAKYKDNNQKEYLNTLFRMQMLAGDYNGSLETIASLRNISKKEGNAAWAVQLIQYELYARAKQKQQSAGISFTDVFTQIFDARFQSMTDLDAANLHTAFITRNGIGGDKCNKLELLPASPTFICHGNTEDTE